MHSKRTLLLVEDEVIIAMDERMVLEKHGYGVVLAANGEQAVKIATENHSIDLVLMDIDLGGAENGVEAARRILAERALPIVFLSSHSEREYVQAVKEITRYGYVLKSAGEFVLIEAIQTAFELFDSHQLLEKSERRYRQMVDTAPMPFQSLDADGCIIDVNRAWLSLLGYKRERVIGMWFGDLLHPDQVHLFRERFPIFKARGHIEHVDFVLRRADGEYIETVFNGCIAYTEDGSFAHTVCIFQQLVPAPVSASRLSKRRCINLKALWGSRMTAGR